MKMYFAYRQSIFEYEAYNVALKIAEYLKEKTGQTIRAKFLYNDEAGKKYFQKLDSIFEQSKNVRDAMLFKGTLPKAVVSGQEIDTDFYIYKSNGKAKIALAMDGVHLDVSIPAKIWINRLVTMEIPFNSADSIYPLLDYRIKDKHNVAERFYKLFLQPYGSRSDYGSRNAILQFMEQSSKHPYVVMSTADYIFGIIYYPELHEIKVVYKQVGCEIVPHVASDSVFEYISGKDTRYIENKEVLFKFVSYEPLNTNGAGGYGISDASRCKNTVVNRLLNMNGFEVDK